MEETRERILREGVFHRTVTLDRAAVNEATRTVELSFSSEAPVERWYGMEILSHKPECVRMGRLMDGAPLLLQHEADDQIGVIDSARIDPDKVGRAVVRFSRCAEAEDIFRDVQDGIRTKVSVGYMVHAAVLAEKEGDTETYIVTDWEPFEVSLVSIPADNGVGVGRSAEMKREEVVEVKEPIPTVSGQNNNTAGRGITMDEQTKTPSPEEVLKAERERVNEIRAYGKRFVGRVDKIEEIAERAEREGWNIAQLKGVVADRVADGKPIDTPVTDLGLSEKEHKEYSLRDLILSQIPGSGVKAGFEKECSAEIAERLGATPKGFFVPYEIQARGKDHPDFRQFFASKSRRDLVTTSNASAGYLVATNLQASSFIDLLRNKMVARLAGVRQLSGLVGNLVIPRQLTSATAVWCTEGTGITSESTQTFDQVPMSPNEVGAYTEISRKMLQQSTPGVDGLIQSDLAIALALARDAAIFHGTGGVQPTGIAATGSIGTFNGAGIAWADVVDAWKDIATANADQASLSWVGNPDSVAVLMGRAKEAGFPQYLMNDNFTMLMSPVYHTNQVTSGYLFFGDFSQAIEGEWGVLDMLVNPYILDKEGLIRITAYQSVDVAVRQPGAFTVASGVN